LIIKKVKKMLKYMTRPGKGRSHDAGHTTTC
jgi:hypothetical protein